MRRGLFRGGRVAAIRFAGLLGLWVVIASASPADLVVGVLAAGCAAMASLRLNPPGAARPRPMALLGLLLRFPGQSLRAGLDVARRTFDPALPLRPGIVVVPAILPDGLARDGFLAWSSLMPGTLPVGSGPVGTGPVGTGEGGMLSVHCLDPASIQVAAWAAEERRFLHAFGLDRVHG